MDGRICLLPTDEKNQERANNSDDNDADNHNHNDADIDIDADIDADAARWELKLCEALKGVDDFCSGRFTEHQQDREVEETIRNEIEINDEIEIEDNQNRPRGMLISIIWWVFIQIHAYYNIIMIHIMILQYDTCL